MELDPIANKSGIHWEYLRTNWILGTMNTKGARQTWKNIKWVTREHTQVQKRLYLVDNNKKTRKLNKERIEECLVVTIFFCKTWFKTKTMFCGNHIFQNPDWGLQPCFVVVIWNQDLAVNDVHWTFSATTRFLCTSSIF